MLRGERTKAWGAQRPKACIQAGSQDPRACPPRTAKGTRASAAPRAGLPQGPAASEQRPRHQCELSPAVLRCRVTHGGLGLWSVVRGDAGGYPHASQPNETEVSVKDGRNQVWMFSVIVSEVCSEETLKEEKVRKKKVPHIPFLTAVCPRVPSSARRDAGG